MNATRRRSVSIHMSVGVAACMAAVWVQTTTAHLCIIREGRESAGTMEASDQFGRTLASGDFNGDGKADLAIGSPFENLSPGSGTRVDAGVVTISYGCPTGITHVGATQFSIGAIGGTVETGDQFGWALAVGRFNSDNYDDLAIGVPGKNGSRGEVRIVYGSASGLNISSSTVISQGNGPGVAEADDIFGFSLAAGDFDNDGIDDLAVGSPGEDLEGTPSGTLTDAGAVIVFFGSAGGITTAGAFVITDDDTVNAAQAGAQFGYALAAGQVGGVANDDLIIGIPFKNVSGFSQHGVLEVLFGGSNGPNPGNTQFFSQVSFGGSNAIGDNFGLVLATGDINNDGFDDLAMGVPNKDGISTANSGRVYVAYGSLFGIRTDNAENFTQTTSSSSDNFGRALAIGDWSGDGFAELAVGIPGKNGAVGQVNIYSGSANGLITSNPSIETQEKLNEVSEPVDNLGRALAFGAFAGGSRKGLAVGAPGENYEPMPTIPQESGITDAGCVYIDMPWKQVQNLGSRTAMVIGCDGQIIFSQKPFTPHQLASTSKIMTALLGCEATQPGCTNCVGLNDVYTFPAVFGGGNVTGGTLGGSMARWCPNEQMTFRELLYSCMLISGNDSAFSIADHVVNPGSNCTASGCADLATFVGMMNARAASLGMTQTSYQNPSGGGHGSLASGGWDSNNQSTCWDMYLLTREAMQNPLFHQIAGSLTYSFTRDQFVQGANMVCTIGSNLFSMNTFQFPIPGGGGPDFPSGSGVKGGNRGDAGACFVGSADFNDGRIYSFVFGCPSNAVRSANTISLLSLATSLGCSFNVVPDPLPVGVMQNFPGTHTEFGRAATIPLNLDFEPNKPVVVRAGLSNGSPSAACSLAIRRTITVVLGPGEQTTTSISPFISHAGIALTNVGANPAAIVVMFNQPNVAETLKLGSREAYSIPAFTAAGIQADATLHISNLSTTESVEIEINDLGWTFDLALNPRASFFEARLMADKLMGEDNVEVVVRGQNSGAGHAVDLTIGQSILTDPGCDGALNVGDADALVLALLDPAAYNTAFPGCYIWSADFNQDGRIDGLDIQAFAGLVLAP